MQSTLKYTPLPMQCICQQFVISCGPVIDLRCLCAIRGVQQNDSRDFIFLVVVICLSYITPDQHEAGKTLQTDDALVVYRKACVMNELGVTEGHIRHSTQVPGIFDCLLKFKKVTTSLSEMKFELGLSVSSSGNIAMKLSSSGCV